MVASGTPVTPTREQVLEWLEEVKDPEIPALSVVELGVIRGVRVGDGVEIDLTPTYSGCPALHVMEEDIRVALARHGVVDVVVRTILTETWTTDWLSETAREKLRSSGIAPPVRQDAESQDLVPLRRVRVVPCPFCGSHATQERSAFGSTACKALFVCSSCRAPFDYFKAI